MTTPHKKGIEEILAEFDEMFEKNRVAIPNEINSLGAQTTRSNVSLNDIKSFITTALTSLHRTLIEEQIERVKGMMKDVDMSETTKRGTLRNAVRRKINYNQAISDILKEYELLLNSLK